MHPGRAHIAPNAKRTGNLNLDAARHGTVHSDAVCQGAVRPHAARHGIFFPCRFLTVCESALLYLRFPFSLSGFRLYAFLVASLLLRVCLALVCCGAKGVRVEYNRLFCGAAIES